MAKDQNGSASGRDGRVDEEEAAAMRSRSKSLDVDGDERAKASRDRSHRGKSKRRKKEEENESSGEESSERRKRRRKKERRRRRRSRSDSSGSSSESESESSYLGSSAESESESDSEEERRRSRRRRRKEREAEEEEKEKDLGKKGAVTNLWGKYDIIREVDMWNKQPEFTVWYQRSSRYYDLDAYHRKTMEKEQKKGLKTLLTERTMFNDEEQRRLELIKKCERQKAEEVEAVKRSLMQSGMFQTMKDQT